MRGGAFARLERSQGEASCLRAAALKPAKTLPRVRDVVKRTGVPPGATGWGKGELRFELVAYGSKQCKELL